VRPINEADTWESFGVTHWVYAMGDVPGHNEDFVIVVLCTNCGMWMRNPIRRVEHCIHTPIEMLDAAFIVPEDDPPYG
jgi:hypothetical protein